MEAFHEADKDGLNYIYSVVFSLSPAGFQCWHSTNMVALAQEITQKGEAQRAIARLPKLWFLWHSVAQRRCEAMGSHA